MATGTPPFLELFYLTPPPKPWYSDDILDAMILRSIPNLTSIIIAPPGTGKTRAASVYIFQLLYGLVDVAHGVRAVMAFEPTHLALKKLERELDQLFEKYGYLGGIRPRPLLFLLHGSIYSCINDEARGLFEKLLDQVRSLTGLELEKGFEIAARLSTGDVDADLLRTLFEYSRESEIEMTFTYLCTLCPYARRDKTDKLLDAILRADVGVVSTEREEAVRLLEDLERRGLMPRGLRACPYRMALRVFLQEPQYREVIGRRFAIALTYAMLTNPLVQEILYMAYSRTEHLGRTMPHAWILDEIEYPVLAPQKAKLPIHLCPDLPGPAQMSPEEIVQYAEKLTGYDPYLNYLRKLLGLAKSLYLRLLDALSEPIGVAERCAEAVVKFFKEEVVRELNVFECWRRGERIPEAVRKAASYLSTWRRKLVERLSTVFQHRPEDVLEDLVKFAVASKTVSFFAFITNKNFKILELPDHILIRRVYVPLASDDVRQLFNVTLDFEHNLAFVTAAGVEFYMLEPALLSVFAHNYPYPVRAKIGLTATLSTSWFENIFRELVHPDIYSAITRRTSVIVLEVDYVNLYYYIAYIFMFAHDYNFLVHCIENNIPLTDEVLDVIRGSIEIFELAGTAAVRARKTIMSMTSASPHLQRYGLSTAADILLNIIHEISYAMTHVLRQSMAKILLVFGTRAQMDEVGKVVAQLRDVLPIEHGVLKIENIDFAAPVDIKRADNFALVVEATYRGKQKLEMYIATTFARSRFNRGIDLEEFNMAFIASPPLVPPGELSFIQTRSWLEAKQEYLQASAATVQIVSRPVRRTIYEEPKIVMLDFSLLSRPYLENYVDWFAAKVADAVHMYRVTPIVSYLLYGRAHDKY